MSPSRPAPLPAVVAHADWSVHPSKRWLAVAILAGSGRYRIALARPVGDLSTFLDGLHAQAGPDGAVLLGVDFPIGLPARYAERAGIESFLAILPRLGRGEWRDFFDVATDPEEISPARPFFPAKPGRRGQFSWRQLLAGLDLEDYAELLRSCDRATAARRAAAALFWTIGAQQVGKAAIAGWRDLLIPALACGRDLKVWPFDGPLERLFAPGRVVMAETYPAEVYGHLGVVFARAGKRDRAARAANARALIEAAGSLGLTLEEPLTREIEDGFGPAPGGEDAFDATVGLLGMLNVVLGRRPTGEPSDPVTRRVEGWILGQDPDQSRR